MCPFTVDEQRFTQPNANGDRVVTMDLSKPQGLPGAIPIKPIPHLDFPRAVYKHPLEPFVVVEHRNTKHEVVEEEYIPAEHLTKVIACLVHLDPANNTASVKHCEACQAELEKALKDGWQLEPYIPKTPPDRNANLYGKQKRAKSE